MKVIHPDRTQAITIVQAMQAVTTAEGRIAPLPIESESVAAIARHLLRQSAPPSVHELTLPTNLASVIVDPVMRRETVRILALLPTIDRKVLAEKARVVDAAAAALGVEDHGLVLLRQAVKRQHRRMALSIIGRSVAHYWSPTGKVRLQDRLDMLRVMLPPIPGLYSLLSDKKLLARYRGLAAKPETTLGRVLHAFYVKRGFPLPGERNSFPEGWGKHEIYHVLSEYDTTLQGEMLNAAFSGGNTELIGMDLLLATLLQFHAGRQILPGPCPSGLLMPDAFFRAVARGAAMKVDLLKGFDMWSVVDRPLDELRADYQIPTLDPQERQGLIAAEALIN